LPESRLSRNPDRRHSAVRLATAALAVVLVSSLLPPRALAAPALAASDADIPGVPLPGSVVTGRLGGPIYDRVYQLDIEPNRIILLSLTGDPGTDFDLYLFDSSATTVYGGLGQVAASTGPTSTESITYPARAGGRYYVDLSGFSDAEGNFRLVVAVAHDTSPPGAEVRLNGGARATTDPTVRVTVIGTDDLSGVQEMQFSGDGTTWTDWQPYRPLTLWSFEDTDGPKRLWARVRDASGNASSTATSEIVLDRVRPTVVETIPAPGATGVSANGSIRIRFSEPIDTSTFESGVLGLQDAGGRPVPTAIHWEQASNTAVLAPTVPLGPGSTYTATVGPVTDFAGNPLVEFGAWMFTVAPVREHEVTLDAAPRTLGYGSTIQLSGSVELPLAAPVVLERSVAGGAWAPIATLALDASGRFSRPIPASSTARYRARIAASTTDAGLSGEVRVLVRRGVAIVGAAAAGGGSRTGSVGRTRSTTVSVSPATPNVEVTLTITRYDPAVRAWRAFATLRRTTVAGRATFSWRPTVAGTYQLRATTPPSALFANGISPIQRWTIT
jgi:hypothetical protein